MHELAITRSVVEAVAERAEGQRVIRVRLQIGKGSAVMPDAIRFCFDLVAENTPLAGARLEIEETSGQELLIQEMEVEPCA
jgi:hydrogenase nickel incorporation protein HypA/HybF